MADGGGPGDGQDRPPAGRRPDRPGVPLPPPGPSRGGSPGGKHFAASATKRRRLRRTQGVAITLAVLAVAIGARALVTSGSDDATVKAEAIDRTGATTTAAPGTGGATTGAAGTGGATTTPTTAARSGGKATLAFAGDTNFENGGASDPKARIAPFAPILAKADFAMVNLETSIAEGGSPVAKDFTFRAPPSVLQGLADSGVDAVTMANNHGMDYGEAGLAESLAAKASSPIPVLGIGKDDDDAFAPLYTTVKGTELAVIGATQVLDSSLISSWTAMPGKGGLASAKRVDRLTAEVRKARAKADTVIVFLHWGVERQTCPSEDQKALSKALREAGADIVIGSHAHRVMSGGWAGKAIVNYGLGNFGFRASRPTAAETGVFEIDLDKGRPTAYRWVPGRINGSVPVPDQGTSADADLASWNQLRSCTDLTDAPT